MCFASSKSVRKSQLLFVQPNTILTVSSEFDSNFVIGLDHTNIVKGKKYRVKINAIYSATFMNTSNDT